jgi:hypothetical protein
MDPILVGAAGTYAVGSALALGAVAGRPAYLATKAAALWAAERVLAAALRPRFDRSASWWVDQHRVRPVARHRAPRGQDIRAGVRLRVDAARAAWSRLTGAVPPFGTGWVTA